MRERKIVVIITPSEALRDEYTMQLSVWGYRVFAPLTIDQAYPIVEMFAPDAVLCDRVADAAVRELAQIAPAEAGFVLITDGPSTDSKTSRAVPGFNAILRERLAKAVARKRGPKKPSASVDTPASLRNGTLAVLLLLVAISLVLVSGFQQRNVLGIVQVHFAGATAPTLQVAEQTIGDGAATFQQFPELLRGKEQPRSHREHGLSAFGLGEGNGELVVAALNVSRQPVHELKLSSWAVDTQSTAQPTKLNRKSGLQSVSQEFSDLLGAYPLNPYGGWNAGEVNGNLILLVSQVRHDANRIVPNERNVERVHENLSDLNNLHLSTSSERNSLAPETVA